MVRRVGDYLLGSTLGEGTFGKVKYATHSVTNEAVAMKVLDKERIMAKKMQDQLLREISIMKTLKHPNIVQLREVLHSKRNIYIVVELCTGGELFDKIVGARRFEEDVARDYFRQLIGGLAYCHAKQVAHRDLKPENLLLSEDGTLKISDFGLSAVMSDQYALQTPCGTPNYVAPEVLSHRGYAGSQADVWSAGVVLYVMLAGALPFEEKTDAALFDKIKRGQYAPFPRYFSEGVKNLLRAILIVDPNKRITIEHIMRDPWFTANNYKPTFYSSGNMDTEPMQRLLDGENELSEEKVTGELAAAMKQKTASMKGPENLDVFSLIAMLDSINLGRMLGYRGDDQVKRQTCFLVMRQAERVFEVAVKLLTDLHLILTPNRTAFKIRCLSARTVFVVQIFVLIDDLCVVQLQRRKGDTLDFHRLYKAVAERLTAVCDALPPAAPTAPKPAASA